MELFRKYCTGDGAVAIRMVSDPVDTLVTPFHCANYEDANFNIEVPVFTVHGNHDDPSRDDAKRVCEGGWALVLCSVRFVSLLARFSAENTECAPPPSAVPCATCVYTQV
jgi:hypothetical protein